MLTRLLGFWCTVSMAMLSTSCSHDMAGMYDIPSVIEMPAAEGPFDTVIAEDLDPTAEVVEVALEAKVAPIEIAPGRTISMWTYNGLLPGPRIEARVGNTVRIHFKNSLPEATTVHWHGLRVPAAMDGATVTQSPVASGGEFTYEFVVKDPGTFWYHPHVRSDEQVERGLYGAIVVRADNEPETTTDRVVVLDDVLVDEDWTLSAFDPMDAMVGRQGNVLLANGRAHPIADMQPGGLHRFRFINAANARYFRLALPGHRLVQIGTDAGALEKPIDVDDILLVPGERADVLVVASNDKGVSTEWTSLRYDRGHGTGDLPDAVVFQSRNTDAAVMTTPMIPTSLSTIAALPAASIQRTLKLEESMTSEGHAGHGAMMDAMFSINGQTYPDGPALAGKLEAVEDWSIVNTTEMDHPFHLHGFRFQIMSVDGVPTNLRAWRDTINIAAKKTVLFRVQLEEHPGTWMFHCHILEHAERGMMGEIEVQ